MTIEPGPDTLWWWQVDDDDAVYSGSSPTEAEAWREACDALGRASPVMVARAEGVTAGLDAMRVRAEAAEARAIAAEAEAAMARGALLLAEEDVEAWRGLLLSRVRERCGDPDLHTDRPGAERDPEHRLWRVVSHRGVAGVGHTEAEALLRAFDAVRPDVLARAEAAEARAAEAEADARLMLRDLVSLDESEGTNVVNYWRELGLTDGECGALRSRFGTPAPGVQELELAAVRRILASVKP